MHLVEKTLQKEISYTSNHVNDVVNYQDVCTQHNLLKIPSIADSLKMHLKFKFKFKFKFKILSWIEVSLE